MFSQLTNKTLSSSSQAELENRLHQLTETLIQKQTMLEALGTEKSSLVFQLERLEQQLKSAQGGQSGGSSINMSTLEGPGQTFFILFFSVTISLTTFYSCLDMKQFKSLVFFFFFGG